MTKLDGNGWRTGRDPIQRWLRIIASVICMVVFAWLALDPERRDWPTLTISLGALLVLLGYEAVVRLPYLGRPENPAEEPPNIYRQYEQPPVERAVIVTGDEVPPEVNN